MLCEVCKASLSKYKCSNCLCPYCSLHCWKKHKSETTCKKKEQSEILQENNSKPIEREKYFTEDTVSEKKLRQLGEGEVLKKLLNNKYLQTILSQLDKASKPEEAVKQAMKDPEFVEFVDECLKIVQDSND